MPCMQTSPKYVLQDVQKYSAPNVSHLKRVDDGVERARVLENTNNSLTVALFTCLLELLNNQNHKLRQIISPKCHIDEKCAMSRFSASGMVLRSQ